MKKLGFMFLTPYLLFSFSMAEEKNEYIIPSILEDKRTISNPESYIKVDKELLKLLLTTFLGKSDLENAYQIAKKGTQLFPSDEYWWDWYAKISIWTNRLGEAFLAAEKLASLKPSKENIMKLFQISLSTNRFDVASSLIIKYGDLLQIKNIKDIVYIFNQSGNIEELIALLDKKYQEEKNPDYLYYLSEINYNYGKMEDALKHIKQLEETKQLDIHQINLYTSILYAMKKYQDSLYVLKKYINNIKNFEKEENKEEISDYYKTLSDLAWFLRDYETSIYASAKLDSLSKSRLVDYIRLSTYYLEKKDYPKAIIFSKKGYEKFKDEYMLSLYVDSLYKSGRWKDLNLLFSSLERESILKSEYLTSIYIRTLLSSNKINQAKDFIKQILKEKFSESILSEAIYLSIDTNDSDLADFILRNYSKYEEKLKKQFALLYSFMQNSEKAISLVYDNIDKSNYDDLLFYADILYNNGREEESRQIKFQIYKDLMKDVNGIDEDPKKLETLIKAGFEFLPDEQLRKYMDLAKLKLDSSTYEDLYFSYLLRIIKHDKLKYLMSLHRRNLRPWMYLNLALWMDDRYWQEELLEKFKDILPIRDRIEALRRTGNINQALYYAHKGLEENRNDYQLYKQYRDLIGNQSSKLENNLSFINWDKIMSLKEELLVYYYLSNGIYLGYQLLDTFTIKNKNLAYQSVENNFYRTFILKKLFDDGYFEIGISLLGDKDEKTGFVFRYNKHLEDKTNINLNIGLNQLSYESIYMFYGGMKDSYSLSLTHNFNSRLFFLVSYMFDIYKSRDDKKIGYSSNLYGESFYKLRIGYPDYTFRIYAQNSSFNEKNTDKGSINKISNYQNPDVLPSSYSSIGVGFLFGFDNRDNYVRVWRPFFSSDIILNNKIGLGYGISAGVGGTLFRQDNLSTGFRYIKDFKGTTTSFWDYFLKYLLFF